jgi:hypothetical protein
MIRRRVNRRGREENVRLTLALVVFLLADVLLLRNSIFGSERGAPYSLREYTSPPPKESVGVLRILYNFKNFWVFWEYSPKPISSVEEFLAVDGNKLWENLFGHFFAFFLGVLFFKVALRVKNGLKIFIALEILNIVHEYVVEGSFVDPSFCDLWLDTFGIIFGFFVLALLSKEVS